MKHLDKFLTEKKTNKKKPHTKKKKEGSDDKQYLELMGKYKQMRRHQKDAPEAQKLLKKALELGIQGNVSSNCKLGACYL